MLHESASSAARSRATQGQCLCFVYPNREQGELRFRRFMRRCQKLSSEAWNHCMRVSLVAQSRLYVPDVPHSTNLADPSPSTPAVKRFFLLSAMMPPSTRSPSPSSNHKSRKRRSRARSLPAALNANEQDINDTSLKRRNSFPVVSKVSSDLIIIL